MTTKQPKKVRAQRKTQEEYDAEPKFFELLSKEDQDLYKKLQDQIELYGKRSKKNQKKGDLDTCLQMIQKFCIRKDATDKIRCFVCGVIWINEVYNGKLVSGLGINVVNLQVLIRKCRSSINTTLRALGYQLIEGRCDSSEYFKHHLPDIPLNRHDLRFWTFRCAEGTDQDTAKIMFQSSKPGQTGRMHAQIFLPSQEDYPQPSLDDHTIPSVFNLDYFPQLDFLTEENGTTIYDYEQSSY